MTLNYVYFKFYAQTITAYWNGKAAKALVWTGYHMKAGGKYCLRRRPFKIFFAVQYPLNSGSEHAIP